MNNRWSDAARTAALAVRQARTLAARPVKGNDKGKPKKALSAPKPSPMVYAGGSATFDEEEAEGSYLDIGHCSSFLLKRKHHPVEDSLQFLSIYCSLCNLPRVRACTVNQHQAD